MENQFQYQQPLLVGGDSSAASINEAYYSGVCAGFSFRSLLTGGSFVPPLETRDPLKLPKTELFFSANDGADVEAPPYNFYTETAPSSLHHQLPSLLSYELPKSAASVDTQARNPRSEANTYGKQRQPRRRQPSRLSEKTQCLRKLLPGEEKMDTATVLEEAYKYIKFLEEQVSVLQSMPSHSDSMNLVGGDYPMLQVATNPAVQAQFCAKGCCVYSSEQLLLLESIAERKGLVDQQMMYDSSTPYFFGA